MTRYDNLGSALDDLADVAMDRYLQQHGFRKADNSRWYQSSTAGGEEVYHRHGHWTNHIGAPEQKHSVLHEPPQTTWNHYRRRLHDAFTAWDALPDFALFHSYASRMFDAAQRGCPLSVPNGHDIENGNGALGHNLTALESELGKFSGATIHAFNAKYTSRLPDVLVHQTSIALLLGICLNYEGHIFARAKHDVSKLLDESFKAMDPDGGGGGLELLVAVVGSIVTVAALVATDGAAAPILSGSAAGLGILDKFLPKNDHSAGHKHADITGHTPDDIIDSIGHNLGNINQWIRAHEDAVDRSLEHARDLMHAKHSDFDLATPSLLRQDDPHRILVDASRGELKIHARDLRRLVRDDLLPIAVSLAHARKLTDQAVLQSPWVRSERVGIGETGPYRTWKSLAESHEQMLHRNATEIRQAGHHLRLATNLLSESDGRVHRELKHDAYKIAAKRARATWS